MLYSDEFAKLLVLRGSGIWKDRAGQGGGVRSSDGVVDFVDFIGFIDDHPGKGCNTFDMGAIKSSRDPLLLWRHL